MLSGKVKWFNDQFGYGFIMLDRGRDVFVHYSVIQNRGYRTLHQGQRVGFELAQGPKGDHATVVVPLTRSNEGVEGSRDSMAGDEIQIADSVDQELAIA